MNTTEYFRKFCDEFTSPDSSKVIGSMRTWVEQHPLSQPEDIEEYLSGMRAKKRSIQRTIVAFYEFYQKHTGYVINSELATKTVIDDTTRRRIDLIKYLQTPHTTSEIADHYLLDDRTIRNDLQCMEKGFEFLGTDIRLIVDSSHRKRYTQSTVNPIFMAMPMVDTVALIAGLQKAAETEPLFKDIFQRTARDLFTQLTVYAQGKCEEFMTKDVLDSFIDLDEIEMYQNDIAATLMLMLIHKKHGTITYIDDTDEVTLTDCWIVGYHNGLIKILTPNANDSISLNVNDIVSCYLI